MPTQMTLQEILKEHKAIRGTPMPEYHAVHHWLKINFGKANKCEGTECLGKSNKYNWALKKGKTYIRDRHNFFRLCKSCHSKYDVTEESRKKMSEAHKNQTKPLETRVKMKQSYLLRRGNNANHKLNIQKANNIRNLSKKGFTTRELSKLFNVCEDTVRRIKRNNTWI